MKLANVRRDIMQSKRLTDAKINEIKRKGQIDFSIMADDGEKIIINGSERLVVNANGCSDKIRIWNGSKISRAK